MSDLALEDAPVAGDVVDAVDAPDVVDAPVDAPVVPAYDPTDDPRMLELVQSQAAQIADRQLRQMIAEAQAAQTPNQPGLPEFFDAEGNFLPESFAAFQAQRDEQIAARFEKAVADVTQPMQQQQHEAAVAEGEQQMRDVIADLSSREGELVNKDVAVARIIDDVRNRYFPQVAQTYGQTNRAAEIALEKAYRAERDYQKQIVDASEAARVNRNTALLGVRGEPGPGAPGVPAAPTTPYAPGALALKFGQQAHTIRNNS